MTDAIKTSIGVRFVASCLFIVFIFVFQKAAILSAIVGVIACFVPESYQAWKISKTEKVYEPNMWLRLAYQSMITKWIMTAMIFAISFSSGIKWDYKILFIGYVLVNVFGLLTPILLKGKRKNVS